MESNKKSKRSRSISSWPKVNRSSVVIFVIFFAVVGAYLLSSSWAAPKTTTVKTPNIILSPASKKVTVSSPLTVEIWADASTQKVNAVQANLAYSIDKLNFVSVDTNGSAFGLAVQSEGGNGKVTIARGSFEPLSGKLLVAKVNFTGAANRGKTAVTVTSDTALISADSNQNILAGTYGGNYTLGN